MSRGGDLEERFPCLALVFHGRADMLVGFKNLQRSLLASVFQFHKLYSLL